MMLRLLLRMNCDQMLLRPLRMNCDQMLLRPLRMNCDQMLLRLLLRMNFRHGGGRDDDHGGGRGDLQQIRLLLSLQP
jgi:hypothetical protein